MNQLNLPGFGARASLYRRGGHYTMNSRGGFVASEQQLFPQQKTGTIVTRYDRYVDWCDALGNCLTENAFSGCTREANLCAGQNLF